MRLRLPLRSRPLLSGLLCAFALPVAARDLPAPVPVTCAVALPAASQVAAPAPAAGAEPAQPGDPQATGAGFIPASEPVGDEIGSEPELDAPHEPAAPVPVSLSIGTPDAGLLLNPVAMPESAFWTIRNPVETYGTQETVDYLQRAIESVQRQFPDSPRLVVGDISRRDGGRLNRHKSHQSGRDVDLGLYYAVGEAGDFRNATAKTLDVPRTWALVRALVTETDVERIFLDRILIRALLAHAREIGEDPDWLDELIGRHRNGMDAILQHERRHQNHLHVRFFNPVAQDCARANHKQLVDQGVLPPPSIRYRIRKGDTISTVARRYGVSTTSIKKANGMRGSFLRAGNSLRIPMQRVSVQETPVVIPPRLLPRVGATMEAAASDAAEAPGRP
ncbi:MAG: penicillin-insensitive murein endopeptidase [Vicinamibacteria bacterium]|nr:penicillin-insensitive murein endopeptidase [Vicinamibacteria bacterium]